MGQRRACQETAMQIDHVYSFFEAHCEKRSILPIHVGNKSIVSFI